VSYKKDKFWIVVVVVSTWTILFIKQLIGRSYTAWDSHDLGFVNFLYFSDSLRDGYIPLWNHFIQAGTFFPSLFNVGLFMPFQTIFVFLSWVISPIYAYELMIQSIAFIGGLGAYLLFLSNTNDRMVSLFGGVAFSATVLASITGQIMFMFSLSSFPWLILVCVRIYKSSSEGLLPYAIVGVIGGMYISSGYVWMNIVNLAIAAIFSLILIAKSFRASSETLLNDTKLIFKKLLVFFTSLVLIYGSLVLPGYLNMQANYNIFSGDYQSPEPRLRSLTKQPHYSYNMVEKALVGAIDPRIAQNDASWFADLPKWSFGAGWVMWIIFLAIPAKRKDFDLQFFWLGVLALSLLYSAGDANFIGPWIEDTPILNANRWWFIGIFYSTICMVFLVVPKLMALKEMPHNPKKYNLRFLLVGVFSIYLLQYFKSTIFQFLLVITILGLVWLLSRVKNKSYWMPLLITLIGINVLAVFSMPYSILLEDRYLTASGEGGYSQQIMDRNKNVVIKENFRQLGSGRDYIYNDERWLKEKTPFSHGYNPLGNPLYWYIKNEPYSSAIFMATQKVREESLLKRENFASDNEFAEAIIEDVTLNMSIPTVDSKNFRQLPMKSSFQWSLLSMKMTPNLVTVKIDINSPSYFIFNNVNSLGWSVYVNGKRRDLVAINRLFQGVFIDASGVYNVVFKYQPKLVIALILLPYLTLIIYTSFYIIKRRKRKVLNVA
jgi:hypothetical protein